MEHLVQVAVWTIERGYELFWVWTVLDPGQRVQDAANAWAATAPAPMPPVP